MATFATTTLIADTPQVHVVTIVLSSITANDLLLNSVKTRVSIGAGF